MRLSAKGIVAATATYFGTDVATLRGSESNPTLHRTRMIAMYLYWELDYGDLTGPREGAST